MTSSSILTHTFATTNSNNSHNSSTSSSSSNNNNKPKKRYKTSDYDDSGGHVAGVGVGGGDDSDDDCLKQFQNLARDAKPPANITTTTTSTDQNNTAAMNDMDNAASLGVSLTQQLKMSSMSPNADLNELMAARNLGGVESSELRNSIGVRLLVFLEDCDGTRSVIFDSDKFTKCATSSMRTSSGSKSTVGTAKMAVSSNVGASAAAAVASNTVSSSSSGGGISNNFNKNSLSSSRLNSEMITRMVFGSFPMKVSNNVAIKVHALRNSNKAMVSNVFTYYHTEKREPNTNSGGVAIGACECLKPAVVGPSSTIATSSSSGEDNMVEENQKTLVKEETSGLFSTSIVNSKPIDIAISQHKSSILVNCSTGPIRAVAASGVAEDRSLSSKGNSNERINLASSESCSFSSPIQPPTLLSPSSGDGDSSSSCAAPSSVAAKIRLNSTSMNSYSTNSTLNNTTCSSMPASYESYTTIYKRLMRSLSNSLITETPANSQTVLTPSSSSNNNAASSSSSAAGLFSSSFKKLSLPSARESNNTPSSNCYSAFINPQTSICQKCIEENCYPKYKIGVSAIYSFRSKQTSVENAEVEQQQRTTTEKNSPSSTTSKGVGGTAALDQLTYFPSISSSAYSSCAASSASSPSSPQHMPSVAAAVATKTASSAAGVSSLSRDSCLQVDNNEDFYEFFFSHLPLIEYQFKELRQKVINFLPAYFANNAKFRKIKSPHSAFNPNAMTITIGGGRSSTASSHRNSISSANGGDTNINRSSSSLQSLPLSSSPSSTSNFHNSNNSNSSMSSFNRLVMAELRVFESKFNLLYSAPRLQQPAWLSLNSSREEALAVTNRLIGELVYLKRHLVASTFKLASSPSSTHASTHHHHHHSRLFAPRSAGRFFEKFLFYNRMPPPVPPPPPPPPPPSSHASILLTDANAMENERNKKFLSTIISTVLKYHLSWIYTVQPTSTPGNSSVESPTCGSAESGSCSLRKHVPDWTRVLEKVNPYNSLWAQLSDLHGAVNQPLRLVRTVVVGQNADLVERLLFLLSYFIRCGTSSYYDVVQEQFDFDRLERLHDSNTPNSSAAASTTNVSSTPNSQQQSAMASTDSNLHLKPCSMSPNTSSHSQTATSAIAASSSSSSPPITKVNVSELKFDPMAQFSSLIFNAMQNAGGAPVNVNDSSSRRFTSSYSSSSSSSSSSFHAPFATDSPRLNNKLNVSTTSKHRRLSSSSNGQNCNAQELPLIGCQMKANNYKSKRMQNNFGFSLLASYSPEFLFEFVLHGTSDRTFFNTLHQRLKFSKNNSILDCPIEESIYLVVDVDAFEVKVFSSEQDKPEIAKPVTMVDSMFESLISMIKMFKSNEFVLLHLEDRLQEFYTKSVTLSKIKSQSVNLSDKALMSLIGLNDLRDMEFINNMIEAITIPNFS